MTGFWRVGGVVLGGNGGLWGPQDSLPCAEAGKTPPQRIHSLHGPYIYQEFWSNTLYL